MNTQQLIAFGVVGLAALYLGRNFVVSARNFFAKKGGGCASGCGKCAFAEKGTPFAARSAQNEKRNIIPLSALTTRPPLPQAGKGDKPSPSALPKN